MQPSEYAKKLVRQYNRNELSAAEAQQLEELIARGEVDLEELQDIHLMNRQLDALFVDPLSRDMRRDFYQMLKTAKQQPAPSRLERWWSSLLHQLRSPALGLATISLLLVTGFSLGYFLNRQDSASRSELQQLQADLQKTQETMMLALLQKESTSERLKAVSLTSEMDEVSEQVADALLHIVNHDPNVNVRLAGLEALFPYASSPKVREGLIRSIRLQDSPIVLTSLAEIMVALQEKRSIREFENILEKKNTPEPVKAAIRKNMDKLI